MLLPTQAPFFPFSERWLRPEPTSPGSGLSPPCSFVRLWPHSQMTVLSPAGVGGGGGHLNEHSWMLLFRTKQYTERELQVAFLASPWMSDLNLGPFSLC